MRVLFACGGTGGHINPAIAVARLVKEKHKNSEILFVGVSGGMEEKLVPAAGFEIRTIKSNALSRKKTLSAIRSNIKAVFRIKTNRNEAKKIICEFRPDVVVGTGGYACFPTVLAASELRIPTVLHEANAYPGLAVRALARKVSKVLLNFEASRGRLPKRTLSPVVGYPVRGDILMYDRAKAREELGIDKPLLVSFWGSLGAREMNKITAEIMRLENENPGEFFHIHASGKFGFEWMPSLLAEKGIDLQNNKYIKLREYIHDMPRVLAAADVVMCRGGAGTLSEISSRGVPAIIVPSPNVTDDHQFKNAMELQKIGGAIVVKESNATPEILLETAKELLVDGEKRAAMSGRLVENATLDATERIYEEIVALVKNK
ncbi:MAG: UDP-N-acetylglucosamine--N-acetylmuramyl-(pentapeptide) pyrophosphoryl-undecaprenol N-acetylglucosamine transferase [Oscillospiraceae bacterium]|nr:UDP-N-acetylglucosamine--N-acetylmuramyl-(pentapeptide) pyrophosphoryl-undecaprenol N-acetylglucosamine transferase [Oscillospiraceae bacterium]